MAAALPRLPQMLEGRNGEGEEGLDLGRSGELVWRWRQSGNLPGRGDSLPHQSCEAQTLAPLPYLLIPRSDSAALASYRRGKNTGKI